MRGFGDDPSRYIPPQKVLPPDYTALKTNCLNMGGIWNKLTMTCQKPQIPPQKVVPPDYTALKINCVQMGGVWYDDTKTCKKSGYGDDITPSTAAVVQSVVEAPAPVDASVAKTIAPAPDPSARARPIGQRSQRPEAQSTSIFGGKVYSQDAVPWVSVFGNRIDNQYIPHPNAHPAAVAAAVASPPPPAAVLPPADAAAVTRQLARVHPAQQAHAWRAMFGKMVLGHRAAAKGGQVEPAVVAAVQSAVSAPDAVVAAPAAVAGFRGFGGLIGWA
jgi:hypothetical protein